MKRIYRILPILLLAASALWAQSAGSQAVSVTPQSSTPAQLAIGRAQAAVEKNGNRAEDLTRLALTQLRRGRETGDLEYVAQADSTIKKA